MLYLPSIGWCWGGCQQRDNEGDSSLPNTYLSPAFDTNPSLPLATCSHQAARRVATRLLNFASAHTCAQSHRCCCAAATTLVRVHTHTSALLCCCCIVCACVHTHKSAAALLLQILCMHPSTHMHTAAHAHTHMYRFRSAAPTNQRRRQVQSYAKCNKHIHTYRCYGTGRCTHQSNTAPNTELRAQCNTHTHTYGCCGTQRSTHQSKMALNSKLYAHFKLEWFSSRHRAKALPFVWAGGGWCVHTGPCSSPWHQPVEDRAGRNTIVKEKNHTGKRQDKKLHGKKKSTNGR